MSRPLRELACSQAREELFDAQLYRAPARRVPKEDNRRLLERLADQKQSHAQF